MKRFSALLILGAVIFIPVTSQASGFTHATSVRVNEHTLMFLLSYEMGHGKYDYRLPTKAVRGEKQNDAVGFDILTGTGLRTSEGGTYAAILSHAPVVDGEYVVKAGTKETFTLVTFVLLPKERSASSTAFALKVNNLPFDIKSGTDYQQNQLTSGELKPFKTAVVDTTSQPK